MPLSIVAALVRNPIRVPAAVLRSRVVKDAEVPALRHENAVLCRQIARVRYEPADRIRLAVLSRPIPRERRRQVFAVTLPAWHRRLVFWKWTFIGRRHPGRPPTAPTVKQLILRLARENSTWGHRRIQGEPARLGYSIAPSTVWEILQSAGADPAPHRSGPTRRQFLTTQAHGVIAAGFPHLATVALERLCALVFVEHGTRRLQFAGVTVHPTTQWTVQQARNLAMTSECRMDSLCFLLRDRDTKYTDAFDAVSRADDVATQGPAGGFLGNSSGPGKCCRPTSSHRSSPHPVGTRKCPCPSTGGDRHTPWGGHCSGRGLTLRAGPAA
ncbi:helix-turn-helix domain-containing protein [Streptomyces sp. NPDC000348]|uniref:helix-turn-helix domain-containing protein n=1 Tax=Streptomyces sp. NPDC000348 TaxID=3364538 RepID=UPI00369D7EBA